MASIQKFLACMLGLTLLMSGCIGAEEAASEADSVDTWEFSTSDASGEMTSGGEDPLIRVTMEGGEPIRWADMLIDIRVDREEWLECTQGFDTGGDCNWDVINRRGQSHLMEITDGFEIREGENNHCNSFAGGCDIEVKLKMYDEDYNIVNIATIQGYADSQN